MAEDGGALRGALGSADESVLEACLVLDEPPRHAAQHTQCVNAALAQLGSAHRELAGAATMAMPCTSRAPDARFRWRWFQDLQELAAAVAMQEQAAAGSSSAASAEAAVSALLHSDDEPAPRSAGAAAAAAAHHDDDDDDDDDDDVGKASSQVELAMEAGLGLERHLICHASEGYFVPSRGGATLCAPLYARGVPGGWLGSSDALLRELLELCPALGVDLRLLRGPVARRGGGMDLSDASLCALQSASARALSGKGGRADAVRHTWLAMYEAARLSVARGSLLLLRATRQR